MASPHQYYPYSLHSYRHLSRTEMRPQRPELASTQTLMPQQRMDPETSSRHRPRLYKPEPDFRTLRLGWRPDGESPCQPISLASASSLSIPGAPQVAYRFADLSTEKRSGQSTYDTAEASIRGRGTWMPSHLAMGRAQAIATGSLGQNSTLYEYVAGVTTKPSPAEMTMRGMVRSGAISAAEAPVERRRDVRDPTAATMRSVEMLPMLSEEEMAMTPAPLRVVKQPKMRLRSGAKSENCLRAGDAPMMSGALQQSPSAVKVKSPRSSPRRPQSATSLARQAHVRPLRICNADPQRTPTPSTVAAPSAANVSLPPSSRTATWSFVPSVHSPLRRSVKPQPLRYRRLSDASSTNSTASFRTAPEEQETEVSACLRRKPIPRPLKSGGPTPRVDSGNPGTPVGAEEPGQSLREEMALVATRLQEPKTGGESSEMTRQTDGSGVERAVTALHGETDTASKRSFSVRSTVSTVKGKVVARYDRAMKKTKSVWSLRGKAGKSKETG